MKKCHGLILCIFALFFSFTLNGQKRYVGANYHPLDDKNPEKVKSDILLMKAAGMNVVRMDEDHYLYLNVSSEPKEIPMKKKSRSILSDKNYTGNFIIAPYEPEFVEVK